MCTVVRLCGSALPWLACAADVGDQVMNPKALSPVLDRALPPTAEDDCLIAGNVLTAAMEASMSHAGVVLND